MQRDLTREAGTPIGGRFWVDEVLGRGGTGVLYRVRDANTGRRVALKCCGTREPEQARKQRALIEREFHTLARIAHPSILEVYECGVDECGSYYTMELLEGELGGDKLAWRDACLVLCDVASTLALLHAHGLLHGDVSRDNLGRDVHGRVKLRDYGAMRCDGARGELRGTPAFVAPEVLHLRALDARADLFSLGALGYSLLTGRDAFGARDLEGLRDAWRSEVMRPSRFAQCPAALEKLLLRLLSLGRSARPACASDVLKTLQAIVATPGADPPEAGPGALVTPPLAGRDQVLIDARLCVLSLLGGTGGTLLIQGEAGSGRSRMLDACVVEGKLLGATVLRVDACAAAGADFGVARALCLQLMPELATQFKGLSHQALGRVIACVQAGEGGMHGLASLERDVVLRELRDFLLALSRGQRLIVAVDDADRIDEPSAALLALLAQKTEDQGLLLAITAERRGTHSESAAMALLRSMAGATVELAPLLPAHTRSLLHSLFGDARNLDGAADLVQRMGRGQPRTTLAMLQHWVDQRCARHEQDGWVLPADATGLPDTLEAVLRARLCAVSADARQLALALCLAEDDAIGLCDYPLLTEHRDFGRVVRALLELVEHRVLIADGERYRFTERDFLPLLREAPGVDGAQSTRLVHAALAELLAISKDHPSRRAHHLLAAGREREAIEVLSQGEPGAGRESLAFLERALLSAEGLAAPLRCRHALQRRLLATAAADLAVDCYRLRAAAVIARLEHAAGLGAWRQLPDAALAERRSRALETARLEHESAAPDARIGTPSEALQELLGLQIETCSLALAVYDVDLLKVLPAFDALAGFATQLDALAELVQGCRQALRGRTLQAIEAYERALVLLSEQTAPGPAEDAQRALRMAVRHHFGLLLAGLGSRTAEQQAHILEAHRECRDRAFQIRVRLHVSQGNVDEARKWHRRHALLRLQRGPGSLSEAAADAAFELLASAFTGDPPALERALAPVARLAESHPGWRSSWCLGECHRRWLQGDLAGAIEALGPALDAALAGRHPHYGYAVAAHVVLLCEQDNSRDGVARGRAYERVCHKAQVGFGDRWLRQGLAYALARSGKHEAAVIMIGQLIEALEGLGIAGLALGSAYEIRAKVALYSGDHDGFERAAKRCSDAYLATNNPAMSGKVAVLAQEAADYPARELAKTIQ